jgi:hypothetical protein
MLIQRSNTGAMVGGAILIGIGTMALVGQFIPQAWQFLWPFFIIGPGLLFFVAMFVSGKSGAPLAIPGSIVTMIGLILLYQSLTNHWESWSYAWTMILTSVGIGIMIAGARSGNASQKKTGWGLTKTGLVLFVIFGTFFEMIFAGSQRGLPQFIFPVLLILVGLYLIITRTGLWKPRVEQALEAKEEPVQQNQESKE